MDAPAAPYRNLTVDEQGIGIAFERAGDDADPMNKPPAKTNVERTPAGLQMILPGCERRTLPKSTSRVDGAGQGLLILQAAEPVGAAGLSCRGTFAVEQRAEGDAAKRVVWLFRAVDWHCRSCWGYGF